MHCIAELDHDVVACTGAAMAGKRLGLIRCCGKAVLSLLAYVKHAWQATGIVFINSLKSPQLSQHLIEFLIPGQSLGHIILFLSAKLCWPLTQLCRAKALMLQLNASAPMQPLPVLSNGQLVLRAQRYWEL